MRWEPDAAPPPHSEARPLRRLPREILRPAMPDVAPQSSASPPPRGNLPASRPVAPTNPPVIARSAFQANARVPRPTPRPGIIASAPPAAITQPHRGAPPNTAAPQPAVRARPPVRPKTPTRPAPPPVPTPTYAHDEIILELPARSAVAQAAPVPRRAIAEAAPAPRRAVQVEAPRAEVVLDELPLDPSACSICHGAGYLRQNVPVGHPLFGRAVPCRCKEEEREQRRREELWRLSSLNAFQEMTFANFNPKVTGTREAWDVARQYAEDPEGWLVLSGTCGSGKTHLAAAIANQQFQQGNLVLFAVVPQLLDHLRAAFAPSSETTYDALFAKVCEAGLLVLDDLGAEHSTPWAQEKLFQIINHRYMFGTPTVITTNLELINDLDDRVRSRLTDISLVRHVRLMATDYRPHHTPPRNR
jgi:DNA replication protein DnaC